MVGVCREHQPIFQGFAADAAKCTLVISRHRLVSIPQAQACVKIRWSFAAIIYSRSIHPITFCHKLFENIGYISCIKKYADERAGCGMQAGF